MVDSTSLGTGSDDEARVGSGRERPMIGLDPVGSVRFGRTVIAVVGGDLLGQGVEAVVVAANRRGVMGAVSTLGLPGLRSFGGSPIEREAMRRAPLDLGSAVVTGAPGLESLGIRAVVHAVVHPALGQPARVEDVRRAVARVLVAADAHRVRSLALPLLGVETGDAAADPGPFVHGVVDELVGCLRRGVVRLDRVTLVCRFDDHRELAAASLGRARERAWTAPS